MWHSDGSPLTLELQPMRARFVCLVLADRHPAFTATLNIRSLRGIHRAYDLSGALDGHYMRRQPIAFAAKQMTSDLPRSLPNGTFDADTEVSRMRAESRAMRRRVTSRLDRYAYELLALRDAGSTTTELQRWLRERRIRVHHTTVGRWLRRNGCE